MTHTEHLISILAPYQETSVLPKFLLWTLNDPVYGSISKASTEPRSRQPILSLIELCKKWVDSGIKPSTTNWELTIKSAGYYAAAVHVKKLITDLDYVVGFAIWKCLEDTQKQIQIDKLNTLIEDERENTGLFSLADYEKD